ncbi:MAG: IclR family transcriptional regulator [Oscillospiraceae bacterium]|nr:IclR family transcriptional regulator [Oscillospiraceae bacterium]
MNNKKPMGTQQGLDRALELMEMLAKNGAGMNVSEISKALGITRVTATAMVQSLYQRNYIEKDRAGKYHIGYKFLELSQVYRYRYPFLYAAENYIRVTAEKLNIRINVCVLKPEGVAVVLLSKDVSLLPKMIFGYVFPAYASASGKLLLATSPHLDVDSWIYDMECTAYTPYTITDKERLLEELDQIRQQGLAYEREEMTLQRCCVAAPIRDISGEVIASVSFSCDKDRFDSEQEFLSENIRLLSETISAALGYNTLM